MCDVKACRRPDVRARTVTGSMRTECSVRIRRMRRAMRCFAILLAIVMVNASWLPPGQASSPPAISGYTQTTWVNSGWGSDAIALRRAKLMVSWNPSSFWSAGVQFFYAYNNGSVTDNRLWVKEVTVRRRLGAGWISLGQFKPEFGLEEITSDALLPTIERTQVSDHLAPDGGLRRSFKRDLGGQWQGHFSRGAWQLTLGMFSGNGALPESAAGNGPLFTARLVRQWRFRQGSRAQFGLSASTRHDHDIDFSGALPGTSALGTNRFRGQDTRWNLQAAADLGHWQARAEFTEAFFNGQGVRSIQARGWYIEGADRFTRRWEAVIRQESFIPRAGVDSPHDVGWTTAGVNWMINRQFDEVRFDYTVRREVPGSTGPNLLAIEVQHYW